MEKVIKDTIADIAIRITDQLVELGYVPDCTDTERENEFEVQDLIREKIAEELGIDQDKEDDSVMVFKDVKQIREHLRSQGYFVQNMWQDGDVIGRATDMGYECELEDVIKIWDIIGNTFNAEYGVNWDTIDEAVETYFKDKK